MSLVRVRSGPEKASDGKGRRRALYVSGAALATVLAGGFASPASAATLNGAWASFGNCPVDNAAMLAADGAASVASCNAADSPSGSIKLGNTKATTGATNMQFGLVKNSDGTSKIVTPSGGAISSAPVAIPGGLIGLMCPSNVPVITQICNSITDSTLNKVTATVRPAGDPSDFSLANGTSAGKPILTMPIKISLSNPFLASGCTIGTDSNPIVLHPQNEAAPTLTTEMWGTDGTPNSSGPMFDTVIKSTLRDDSFAVPGASNCGLAGAIDLAVDLKTGIPSKAGNNSLVLSDNTTHALGGFLAPRLQAPDEGQKLSDAWHSAVQ